MPTVAQGISKITVIKKQTGLGAPASGSGGQILRRRTSKFALAKERYESDEIVSHQQSTGSMPGVRSTTGALEGLLSAGTYKLPFQSLLRKDFVAGINSTALTNVTAAVTVAPAGTFTRAAGSFITDGFKVGDVIRWAGWATTGVPNNAHNMVITALSALVMTCYPVDGVAITAKAAGDSVTATVFGKKTLAPMSGHTKDYYTVEEYYPDLTPVVSEKFQDVIVAKADVQMPATGFVSVNFDMPGLGRTTTAAQVLTTPTAETTSEPLTAVQGLLVVNGVVQAIVTGINFSIDGSNSKVGPVISTNNLPDHAWGRIKVTGQFTALFTDKTFMDLYDADTAIGIILVVTEDTTPAANFVSCVMGRLKITGADPDDGEKGIERTYPFVAELNDAGGAATAFDQTIFAMQDSLA